MKQKVDMSERIWQVEWNDSMSFGNPVADEEHKQLIALINRLNVTVVDRMATDAVVKATNDILAFVNFHFPNEERLFKEVGYPDADDHTQKHAELKTLLGQTMERARTESSDYSLIEAGLNIKEEMINHLLTEDLKYAEFCRNS